MSAVLEKEEAPEIPKFEFDGDFQAKLVALKLRDTRFNERTDGILKPQYFENEVHAQVVALVDHYYETYRKAPDAALLRTMIVEAVKSKRLRKDQVEDVIAVINAAKKTDISDRNFVIDQVARFAKRQAVEAAILASVELIEKEDFSKIEVMLKTALQTGAADEDEGRDYWDRIEARTQRRKEEASGARPKTGITTGMKELDEALHHHGWGRRELSLIMGAAKAGKSMSLGEFAKSASLAGKNVLYITLEVSADIIEDRIDANISDTAMRVLSSTPHDVERKLKARYASGKCGIFKMHEYASGTFKTSQLRRLLERYRARGVTFDAVFVDYADIMAPERFTGDLKEDMRLIYLDLRAVAFDYDLAMVTATQTNRTGAGKLTSTMTDVADDFNKIRTADVVISINTTGDERAAGEVRMFFAASRNSEDGFTLRFKQDRSKMQFFTKYLGRE